MMIMRRNGGACECVFRRLPRLKARWLRGRKRFHREEQQIISAHTQRVDDDKKKDSRRHQQEKNVIPSEMWNNSMRDVCSVL